jgi:ferredoxin-NADP reductase/MOSC domain-containing protein YiiM
MKVISVNIGVPRKIQINGQEVETSIFKSPVGGKVSVGKLNLEGDVQADKAAHGGEHRALMIYQTESYEFWRKELKRDDLAYGLFGENLTVQGLADEEVCIGDRYQIGTCLFEVTQPRVTCFKVGISIGVPEMPALLVAKRRPGFYFRVLREGELIAGDEIIKVAGGPEGMSVADVDGLLYSAGHSAEKLQKALNIPALSAGWQSSFRELAEAVKKGLKGNPGLAGLTLPLAWPGFRLLKITRIIKESANVLSFRLEDLTAEPLPSYKPGQHIAVKIPAGDSGTPIIRMYSLCGPADTGYYRIAVKLEGGPGSSYLHRQLPAGALLPFSAPRGNFILSDNESPVVLLSAGVGITPMLGMLNHLSINNDQRTVHWIHSAQDSEHHSFAGEIKALIAKSSNFRTVSLYSKPLATDLAGKDFDYKGRLTAEIIRQLNLPANSECYICGPAAYTRDLTGWLVQNGINKEKIFTELFAEEQPAPGGKPPHAPAIDSGTGPTITFTKSKISMKWGEQYQSLLEAVEACDIPARWSCRTGVCHRCECSLVDGEVAYYK